MMKQNTMFTYVPYSDSFRSIEIEIVEELLDLATRNNERCS
jgi:hypothetical protein